MLICIEGLTNSGKTTLCKSLMKHGSFLYINDTLKSDIVATNIKRITHPIENAGRFDNNTEFLLYLALLSQKAMIAKKWAGANNIIVDRFSLSVFSQALISCNHIKSDLMRFISFATCGIIPDYTIFLDASIDTIVRRSVSSPFSRKDKYIIENYNSLRNTYLQNLAEHSLSYDIVPCNDNISVSDLTQIALQLLKSHEITA